MTLWQIWFSHTKDTHVLFWDLWYGSQRFSYHYSISLEPGFSKYKRTGPRGQLVCIFQGKWWGLLLNIKKKKKTKIPSFLVLIKFIVIFLNIWCRIICLLRMHVLFNVWIYCWVLWKRILSFYLLIGLRVTILLSVLHTCLRGWLERMNNSNMN